MKKESIRAYSYRISQASRTELVVVMYDMAIEYLEDARAALTAEDDGSYCRNVKLAKRVVDTLTSALDMQYDIAAELFEIYQTMARILIRAATKKEASSIQAVIRMLSKLRKAFNELSQEDTSGAVMKNTQQVYAGLTYSNLGSSNEFSDDPVKNRGFIV